MQFRDITINLWRTLKLIRLFFNTLLFFFFALHSRFIIICNEFFFLSVLFQNVFFSTSVLYFRNRNTHFTFNFITITLYSPIAWISIAFYLFLLFFSFKFSLLKREIKCEAWAIFTAKSMQINIYMQLIVYRHHWDFLSFIFMNYFFLSLYYLRNMN